MPALPPSNPLLDGVARETWRVASDPHQPKGGTLEELAQSVAAEAYRGEVLGTASGAALAGSLAIGAGGASLVVLDALAEAREVVSARGGAPAEQLAAFPGVLTSSVKHKMTHKLRSAMQIMLGTGLPSAAATVGAAVAAPTLGLCAGTALASKALLAHGLGALPDPTAQLRRFLPSR